MGVLTAKDIINRASFILKDPENVRWLRDVMLDYVNEAQAAVVRFQPSANKVRTTIKLQEGTSQELPEDALCLLTVTRNMLDGEPGPAIRLATRSIYDAMFYDWHEQWPESYVINYIYDDREGREFEVYPPNDGSGEIEVVYSALPPIIKEEDKLTLGDEFGTIITNYVLYKCALLDSDFNGTQSLAQFYYQLYLSELNGQSQAQSKEGPGPSHSTGPIASNGGTE